MFHRFLSPAQLLWHDFLKITENKLGYYYIKGIIKKLVNRPFNDTAVAGITVRSFTFYLSSAFKNEQCYTYIECSLAVSLLS